MRRVPVVLLIALVACGGAAEPIVIPEAEIPFPLTREVRPSPPGVDEHRFTIMLVRNRKVQAVRRVERLALPVEEVAIRSLLAGPTRIEADRGLTTEIPSTARLLDIGVFDGVAEVDLSQGFQAASASQGFQLRVAQVVTTLTGLPDVTAVRISIDGEVVGVPTDRGEIVLRPVTSADYKRLQRT